ncbi:superoxide dismutase [Cu-Zn] precursor [Legionella birminghamensis]|uniref:Superoxide dismutase [Cu-Zn] n=1 Tax=Legionella birminghamensis TaxID=28083 RepID=A0A378I8S0_9GAMM|nr:superoxide dismutase family protein [Legionella birminghamensis]KTC68105.1 superoxide dismutase [Cu-Zn] precursor [Legionella birminghamensis]STX31185.1 Cu/Zn superoxide dismutase [Legionella birminghamensis]
MKKIMACLSFCLSVTHAALAQEVSTKVYTTDKNTLLGEVIFKDSDYGLLIIPSLSNLPAGAHGFHLHQNADCSEAGMAAGGHFDPHKTNQHKGPYSSGHLGDLPVLFVMEDGKANTPLLAPRLKTSDLKNLALMIHAGGDNYSDNPPLGGGGARLGCGVIN